MNQVEMGALDEGDPLLPTFVRCGRLVRVGSLDLSAVYLQRDF